MVNEYKQRMREARQSFSKTKDKIGGKEKFKKATYIKEEIGPKAKEGAKTVSVLL